MNNRIFRLRVSSEIALKIRSGKLRMISHQATKTWMKVHDFCEKDDLIEFWSSPKEYRVMVYPLFIKKVRYTTGVRIIIEFQKL